MSASAATGSKSAFPARTLPVLIAGTLAISTAAPFIKLAQMSPLTLTAGRLIGVALLYAVIGRDVVAAWRALSPKDRRLIIFGTPLLAGHFACWIAAFEFTDLPSAVLLLVLQPILGSLFGARVFREHVTRGAVAALALAVVGLALIVWDDLQLSWRHLFGDALVAIAALLITLFFSIGKRLRPRMSFPAYMSLTYGSAGLWALLLLLVARAPVTGYTPSSYYWLLGLIFITTGIGHAALNYALPYARLFTVNLMTVAEPVLAILAAVLWLGESVTGAELAGGALLVVALLVGVRDEWGPGVARRGPESAATGRS